MSKFEECKSVITQVGKINTAIETTLYIFAESQCCGTEDYHSHTIWNWKDKEIHIKEVGIHPCKKI